MPKTQLSINFLIPTTSFARVQDVMTALKEIVDKNRGENFFTTISGPLADNTEKTNGKESRTELGRHAAAAFDDGTGDGDGDDAGDGEPVKRKRGRPPGSTKAARTASGDVDGDDDAGTGSREGNRGPKPDGTRKVAGKGAGEGKGRGGSTGGSRDDQRRNSEPAEVDEPEEWGDEPEENGGDGEWGDEPDTADAEISEEDAAKSDEEWPDELTPSKVDKTVIQTLLGDHYKASGGKDRVATFAVMEDVTGERQLGNVPEKKYRKLAKALLKDIARFTYGVKKPK